ncbi:iron ABC transporter permease [Ectothiorhodospiraceae bacterium WFHF3C12]|nr:iron ABC transporter permease [Ectothiorhodospiraceae bacterium WFHF3C12]
MAAIATARFRAGGARQWLPSGWSSAVLLVAAVLGLPVVTVVVYAFYGADGVWSHLAGTVLPTYVYNSLLLSLGVGAGTLVIGTGTAWLTVMCDFPGRRLMTWLLLLPLSMPAYIIAYTYTGMLDFAGPVQSTLRAWFGWGYGDYFFPEIRSLPGAAVMLTLVLYPYVYLLSRAAFLEQSVCALDVGRTMGLSPWQVFRRIALPLARPAIVTGLSLVLMETLADYGTVKYFGVSTFTTGIFRTWFGMGEPAAAAQLAAVLLGAVVLLILLERWSRRQRQYHHTSGRYQPLSAYRLSLGRGYLALLACVSPVVLGFALPALQLLSWSADTMAEQLGRGFPQLVFHSLLLAALTSILALGLALLLAYGRRLRGTTAVRAAVGTAGLGYAIPGTVIAVGVILPFAWLDNTIDAWARAHLGVSTGLILSGTLVALVFAYLVRFLAVSLQTVESGLAKIAISLDETARSLGANPTRTLRTVHMPIMRGSLLTAVLLVFVDVMKELPATLILRPFDFNTLAVRAFELASDEQLAAAAPSALAIAIAGLAPVILLSRSIARSRPGQGANA